MRKSKVPRQQLDEILSKYELHPETFDIYVEGEFDSDFFSQYLQSKDASDIGTVLPIDAVDIDDGKLVELGLNPGSQKSRVIALSMEIERQLDIRLRNVYCIVDADTDRLLKRVLKISPLTYTDFTCLEMYFYNTATLRRFFTLTCKLKDEHHREFLQIASLILPYQFAVRAVNEEKQLNVAIPSFSRGLTEKRKVASFDPKKYVGAFISDGGLRHERAVIEKAVNQLCSEIPKDARHGANGHDFIELLFNFLWEKDSLQLHDKRADVTSYGGRLLATASASETLTVEKLFKSIDLSVQAVRIALEKGGILR